MAWKVGTWCQGCWPKLVPTIQGTWWKEKNQLLLTSTCAEAHSNPRKHTNFMLHANTKAFFNPLAPRFVLLGYTLWRCLYSSGAGKSSTGWKEYLDSKSSVKREEYYVMPPTDLGLLRTFPIYQSPLGSAVWKACSTHQSKVPETTKASPWVPLMNSGYPKTLYLGLGMVAGACNQGLWKQKSEYHWGLLASQSDQLQSSRFSERPYLRQIWWRAIKEDT